MTMVNVFRVWPFLLITLFFLTACSDDGTSPQTSNQLTGQVLDAQGAPMAGAGIIMNYALPAKNRPSTRFDFQLAAAGPVKCWIMSDCWADTVRVLVDEVLDPGAHSILWDGRNAEGQIVPSGLFTVYYQAGGDLTDYPIMVMHDGYPAQANPVDYQFEATTAEDGTFVIEQDCRAFGYTFAAVDEMGDTTGTWTVSREVQFFAMHPDFNTAASGWVTADENLGCHVTIEFEGP